ncbi:hypothetical protein [Alistipes sp.]|uniref:hypothetical protein n=1 Tax=Alistipes sp. TaxID=1872444 RepID=UPI003AB3F27E
MDSFDVDFRKLGSLLLPTFWRRPLLTAFVEALLTPLHEIHADFTRARSKTNYRLSHNGQVCYLRAVLNDTFDPVGRRITITDVADDAANTTLYMRSEGRAIVLPRRDSGQAVTFNRRGFSGVNRYDFEVRVPVVLSGADDIRLRAMVSAYKLATKRFVVTYISIA